MTDSDKKVDFCVESDLKKYKRENPPQEFSVQNERETITPTDVVWLYEVGSFPLPLNWLTKRFLAWKINRKIKRFNKWQEK